MPGMLSLDSAVNDDAGQATTVGLFALGNGCCYVFCGLMEDGNGYRTKRP